MGKKRYWEKDNGKKEMGWEIVGKQTFGVEQVAEAGIIPTTAGTTLNTATHLTNTNTDANTNKHTNTITYQIQTQIQSQIKSKHKYKSNTEVADAGIILRTAQEYKQRQRQRQSQRRDWHTNDGNCSKMKF